MSTSAARAGSPARAVARRGTWAAALALACVVTSLASLVVVGRDGAWGLPAAAHLPVDAAIGVVYAVVGAAVVLARGGSPRLGGVLLAAGAFGSLTVCATAVAATAREVDTTALVAVWVQSWSWVLATAPLLTLVPLLFPDGRLPGRGWWAAAVAAVVGTLLVSAGVAAFPEPFEGRLTIERPLTDESLARVLVPAGAVLLLGALLAAAASLVVRVRRATGLARRQVLVVAVAAAVLLAHTLVVGSIPAPWDAWTQAVAACLVPVAIGVAATRHRLYDLDVAVCRGIVALSLAVCLAAVYAALVALAQPLLDGRPGLVVALAAGVTGLLVRPLALRLHRGVDRMYYGDRGDPQAVLGALSARLGGGLDVAEVPAAVCDTVVGTLRLGGARLELALGQEGMTAATAGGPEPVGEPWRLTLRHRGEEVGALVVAPRPGEREVAARDRELLESVGGLVAPSLAALRLHHDLQRSREAVVVAREEERRRVRRELHDGVGAALAGVRLQLDTALAAVAGQPVEPLLRAAGAGVEAATTDVRAVSDDLRPPALDELGLSGSLHALARRVATPDVRVEVDVPRLPPLPAAVEVAAYRTASEALVNAVRHSGGTRVLLRVETTPGALVLDVLDDGRGAGAAARDGGQGVPSMRLRAAELGGTCEVGPGADHGTLVRVRLPVAVPVVAP
ncbi:sensor histidine kinase [Aquipuribacter sp. SD81]|uniref:sensor histidine kinase n=1 Tax=Aquipuribacter sp. SD81 TaxID=3127703 RepID=UPI00301724FC